MCVGGYYDSNGTFHKLYISRYDKHGNCYDPQYIKGLSQFLNTQTEDLLHHSMVQSTQDRSEVQNNQFKGILESHPIVDIYSGGASGMGKSKEWGKHHSGGGGKNKSHHPVGGISPHMHGYKGILSNNANNTTGAVSNLNKNTVTYAINNTNAIPLPSKNYHSWNNSAMNSPSRQPTPGDGSVSNNTVTAGETINMLLNNYLNSTQVYQNISSNLNTKVTVGSSTKQ